MKMWGQSKLCFRNADMLLIKRKGIQFQPGGIVSFSGPFWQGDSQNEKSPEWLFPFKGFASFLRLSLGLIVVAVGALAGCIQRRTALAAKFGYRCILRTLGLCCLGLELLAQAAHIGNRENAVLFPIFVLVAEFIVDGNHILQQQNRHHQQFIHESDHNGSHDHDQKAIATQPVTAAKIVFRHSKEHEETQDDHLRCEKNVQSLQNLLYDQILEIEGIMEKLAKSVELFPAIFRDDEHIGQNRSDRSQNAAEETERAELLEHI